MLESSLLPDSQKKKILHLRNLILRNKAAATNPHEEVPHGITDLAETLTAHTGAAIRVFYQGKRGPDSTNFVITQKIISEALGVVVSQNNHHLTLTSPKLIAALHNIFSKRTSVEKCAFRVTSALKARFSKPTYKVCIRVEHCSNQPQPHTCFLGTGAELDIINSMPIQDN